MVVHDAASEVHRGEVVVPSGDDGPPGCTVGGEHCRVAVGVGVGQQVCVGMKGGALCGVQGAAAEAAVLPEDVPAGVPDAGLEVGPVGGGGVGQEGGCKLVDQGAEFSSGVGEVEEQKGKSLDFFFFFFFNNGRTQQRSGKNYRDRRTEGTKQKRESRQRQKVKLAGETRQERPAPGLRMLLLP